MTTTKLEQRLQNWENHYGLMEECNNDPLIMIKFETLQQAFEFWLGEDYNNLTYQQVSYQLKKRGY